MPLFAFSSSNPYSIIVKSLRSIATQLPDRIPRFLKGDSCCESDT